MNITRFKTLLNPNKKVLNIYHKDLDGCVSSIVMKNVYKNIEFKDLRYGQVNAYLKTLDFSNYDAVILTDISPETEDAFDLADNIFLLDHHDSALEFHNPDKNRIVIAGKSAALLVKDFYESLFNLDLSYLKDLCDAANDYDMWINKDKRGWSLNEMYFKLWDIEFRKRFGNGDIVFTPAEQKHLDDNLKDLEERYKSTEIYKFDSINGCYIFATNYINEICHKIMENKGYELIIAFNPKTKNCSVRSINENLHVGFMLQELNFGGGHKPAGGFSVKEPIEMDEKLNKIEQYILANVKDMKKNV